MIRSDAQPEALLAWMDGLADPARLRLLRILERHELGVAELCHVLQMPQSTVSRHLKLLLDQAWLSSRRQGTNHLYEMILDELSPAARKLWLLAREQTQDWATASQDELRLQRVLETRQPDSQAFFAGAVSQWDRLRGELYGQRFDLHAVLPLLPPGATLVDLGCGTAALAAQIAPHVKRVIGIDNSADMLKVARRRTAALDNVELRRGELAELPLADGEADIVLMILALTYVSDPPAVIRELSRILAPGGRAVIIDLLRHDRDDFRRQLEQKWMGFDPAELAKMLRHAGMEQANVRPLPPDQQAKAPALFVAWARKNASIPKEGK